MRVFAVLSVSAVLVITVSTALAGDFDALLSELTFDNAPPGNDEITLDVAAAKAAESLEPAPSKTASELVMPTKTDAVPSDLPAPDVAAAPLTDAAPIADTMQAPVAVAQPAPTVDFNQAFAAQECNSCGDCNAACDGRGVHGECGHSGCGLRDKMCATCVPYHPPRLPSSTFYQYFRSNACNVDVWNGYQNRCCYAAKHTRGECDCFKKDRHCAACGPVLYDAPCVSHACDAPRPVHATKRHAKRIFDIAKHMNCDDCDEACDSAAACCEGMLTNE